MKYTIVLITLLITSSCVTNRISPSEEVVIPNHEPGKCHFTLWFESASSAVDRNGRIIETTFEKAFIIEAVPPKIKRVNASYSTEEIRGKLNSDGIATIRTMDPFLRHVFMNRDLSPITSIQNPYGYSLCKTEGPATFKTFYEKDLIGDSITISQGQLISKSKFIKYYVKRKPRNLTENQLYFDEGYWTMPKEAIYRGGCGGQDLIINIKKILNEQHGYSLREDSKFDEKTKEAIVDFQRKNGLKVGNLDYETLIKLGFK